MLIYDILHKEKVYQIVANDLRNFGVKYRLKKNAIKTEKPEKSGSALRRVFKTHLSHLPLDVVNLSSGAIVHVPVFVTRAIEYLDKHITQEGLFRKAGSQFRQKELMARIDNGGSLSEKYQAVDVANSLKAFFRDLPEPLIPYQYHDLFLRCVMLKCHRVEALLLACILLPPHHLNTLAYFVDFLKKVSCYEKENKMSVDNLAKVVGPNLMPLQETTMSAVRSRLEMHLIIVKILIENAEHIGVLPDHLIEIFSAETSGSTENELNRSDSLLRSKNKKKKRRSGSLTRMFNGLKKMVGKSDSLVELSTADKQLCPVVSNQQHTPAIKNVRKRKVTEPVGTLSAKKKRDLLDVMPYNPSLHPYHLFVSPVSKDPNPVKEKSPNEKSKVRKYLSHKIHSEMGIGQKLDKPKKIRLSFERLVSRNKQKIADMGVDFSKEMNSPKIERRWSSASSSSGSKKKRRTASDLPDNFESINNANEQPADDAFQKDYDQIFMTADVNLSDDSGEQASQEIMKSDQRNRVPFVRIGAKRRSLDSAFSPQSSTEYKVEYITKPESRDLKRSIDLDNFTLEPSSSSGISLFEATKSNSSVFQDQNEEYVRISKSEYEEIKNRVSAIESRISQEFGSISDDSRNNATGCSAISVQSEYEKTLEEASIEDTVTADHLAKKLGKELKIRRSSEHRVIRSPSARKIGNLRRRSQEKPSSKRTVSRNASWHISQRTDIEQLIQSNPPLNNVCQESNLKRGKQAATFPRLPRSESSRNTVPDSICSDETNARLIFLQKQLHALISHTTEHTRGSSSDDEMNTTDDDVFETNERRVPTLLGRASSFHGDEFIDNSRYFNNKIRELKKTNSQQDMTFGDDRPDRKKVEPESRDDKTVTWRDAGGYFKSDRQLCTPTPQTGRASVARLRKQNAGMVLAKAKLFDEPTTNYSNAKQDSSAEKNVFQSKASRKQSTKVIRLGEFRSLDLDTASSSPKKVLHGKKNVKSPKNSNTKVKLAQSPRIPPLIKMELTIIPPQNVQQDVDKRSSRRHSQMIDRQSLDLSKSNSKISARQESINLKTYQADLAEYQKENKITKSPPSFGKVSKNAILQESDVNVYNLEINAACKTPHIKRPLSVKTPKSSRTLARKPTVDSRRTPLKAVAPLGTPKRQSPKSVLKSRHLSRHVS